MIAGRVRSLQAILVAFALFAAAPRGALPLNQLPEPRERGAQAEVPATTLDKEDVSSCTTALIGSPPGLRPVAFQPAARLGRGPVASSWSLSRPRGVSSGAKSDAIERPVESGEWRPVATEQVHLGVDARQHVAVRIDFGGRKLELTKPDDRLTASARAAIDYAPDWLADDLAAAFAELQPARQDLYAQLLLATRDPIVDEVAFQIAHLGPGSLNHRLFTPELLVRNAELMYLHDKELQYVDIVDHGSAARGGDYYSTTQYFYRRGPGGGIVWSEIPRDIYYWYVVHPRLSDETVKASSEASSRQATYGYFWREYLFHNPDPSHDYTAPSRGYSGFPLLADVLRRPKVVWDGETVNLDGERPFGEDDVALDVIGHWVSSILPDKAVGNRPVQPNQIAFEHNGNCGEIQDLLGAASRTALVPNVLTSDHCEDHVWNEVYVAYPTPGWIPYQVDWDGGPTRINVDGIAYDRDRGGGKDVSAVWAWRPDGLAMDIVDRYSNACSLIVRVVDAHGRPVDGAFVTIFSEAWQSTEFIPATFASTNAAGLATFRLGDKQNYALRVESGLGNHPGDGSSIVQVIADAVAEETYVYDVQLPGSQRSLAYERMAAPGGDAFRVVAQFSVAGEFATGSSPFAPDSLFRARYEPGRLVAFITGEQGYAAYLRGAQFGALDATEDQANGEMELQFGGSQEPLILLLAADPRHRNRQLLDLTLSLYEPLPPATVTPAATATLPWPKARLHLPWANRGQ